MEHENITGILKRAGTKTIKNLVYKLNADGIVSDEDGCMVSSYMIEHWSAECDSYLSSNGYIGSRLVTHGKFFQSHGAVYVLFDEDRHTYKTATEYMNNHVENYEY